MKRLAIVALFLSVLYNLNAAESVVLTAARKELDRTMEVGKILIK